MAFSTSWSWVIACGSWDPDRLSSYFYASKSLAASSTVATPARYLRNYLTGGRGLYARWRDYVFTISRSRPCARRVGGGVCSQPEYSHQVLENVRLRS